MLTTLIALLIAALLSWWNWRGRLEAPLARVAAASRIIGLTALLLLVLDPGIATRALGRRPLVLLDNSVSMHATAGRANEAAALAAGLGDTVPFGELAPGLPGTRSALAEPLSGAVSTGRPVVVVTDGEVVDRAAIPPELLAQTTVRVLPRTPGPDIALVDVRGPVRLATGDTLALEVEAVRQGGAADSALVELRDGTSVLTRGVVHFGTADRARVRLLALLPPGIRGDRWLEVALGGARDSEPLDDVRWWLVNVTPAPGIVMIASAPDWDARALYRTLRDVANAPARGYVQLEAGNWRRMDDLRKVTSAEVTAAARAADLLAVRGDPQPWRAMGRARLLWPLADQAGDWYVTPAGVSPVAGAFAGVEPDSLPPAAAVRRIEIDSIRGWIGASARQGRRGPALPIIGGAIGPNGRTVQLAADGLYRWGFRGGASDQVWRSMIATATSWLLAAPESDGTRARPVSSVTERGRPVRFRWTAAGPAQPLAVTFSADSVTRTDTLRFDGDNEALVALDVGRYRYSVAGGGTGTLGVEPYSDELVPAPVTLREQAAGNATTGPRRSLRELWPLFLIAIIGFGAEWMLRRRLGLR